MEELVEMVSQTSQSWFRVESGKRAKVREKQRKQRVLQNAE